MQERTKEITTFATWFAMWFEVENVPFSIFAVSYAGRTHSTEKQARKTILQHLDEVQKIITLTDIKKR